MKIVAQGGTTLFQFEKTARYARNGDFHLTDAQVNAMQRNSGFTIVELATVIAIVAVISAIAVPNLYGWLPDYRLKNAARELFGELQQAKLSAIKDNADFSINFATSPGHRYTIPADGRTVVLDTYGSEIKFLGPGGETFSNATLTFNARGTSNSCYAYLTNANNSAYYRVGALASGAVRLQRYNGSTWE
jgi:type IV fimbrial biogenesis protein FimT